MKIALLTGRLAYKKVREIADEISKKYPSLELHVVQLPIDVAAMISERYLLSILPDLRDKLREIDLIVVPGYTHGDMTIVATALGKPVVKGPKHAHDIPLFIEMLMKGMEFSPVKPADEVILVSKSTTSQRTLESLKQEARRDHYFTIGNVPISSHYPTILLEVYPAVVKHVEDIAKAVEIADMISIGIPVHEDPRDYIDLIRSIKERFHKPIGIDVYSIDNIGTVAEHVDFVNGVRVDEINRVIAERDKLKDKGIIVVDDKLEPGQVKAVISKLRESGLYRVIFDPVMKPPIIGAMSSLLRIHEIRKTIPDTPLLMGVGNVTEMVDVDSLGVNALLAFIGVELGVEVYMTTETSPKARGSTLELRRALDMGVLARKYNTVPKDLGISLLCLKDKRRVHSDYTRAPEHVTASRKWNYGVDPRGFFKIYVDHSSRNIILQHFKYDENTPDLEIVGDDPQSLLREVIERGLAMSPDHFFYLGYELAKAEIALRLGKNYAQDSRLFECEYT